MMGVPSTPGVADVLAQRVSWAGAITSVVVSRGRSIDVLPSGVLTGTLQAVTEQFSAEVDHLSRRYETVVVSASTPEQGTITVAAGAVGEVVICLRRGRSTHALLRAVLAALGRVAQSSGIVLWDRAGIRCLRRRAGGRSGWSWWVSTTYDGVHAVTDRFLVSLLPGSQTAVAVTERTGKRLKRRS